MTNETKRAILELAYALCSDPEGRKELSVYGNLPDHLKDVIIDLMADDIDL